MTEPVAAGSSGTAMRCNLAIIASVEARNSFMVLSGVVSSGVMAHAGVGIIP